MILRTGVAATFLAAGFAAWEGTRILRRIELLAIEQEAQIRQNRHAVKDLSAGVQRALEARTTVEATARMRGQHETLLAAAEAFASRVSAQEVSVLLDDVRGRLAEIDAA